jgi:hypothetical protein
MLANVSPYPDGSNTQIIVWTCTRDPIPLSAVRPPVDVPPGLESLIDDTMARDPNRRPASAAAFLARLESVTRGEAVDTSWPALDPAALSASVANLGAQPEIPRSARKPSSPAVPAVSAQPPGPFVQALEGPARVQMRDSALASGERALLAPPKAKASLVDEDATVDADADSLEGLLAGVDGYDDDSAMGGPTVRPRARRPEPASISRIEDSAPPTRIDVELGAGPTLATPGLSANDLQRVEGPSRVSDAVRHVVRAVSQADLDAADESTVAFAEISPPPPEPPAPVQRSKMLWAAPLAAALGVGAALWWGSRGGSADASISQTPGSAAAPATAVRSAAYGDGSPVVVGLGAGAGGGRVPASAVVAPSAAPDAAIAIQPPSQAPASTAPNLVPASTAPSRAAATAPPDPPRAPATRAPAAPRTEAARAPATEPTRLLVARPPKASDAAEAGASLARADAAMRAGDYPKALTEYRGFQRKADARTRQLHPEVDDRIRWLEQQVK